MEVRTPLIVMSRTYSVEISQERLELGLEDKLLTLLHSTSLAIKGLFQELSLRISMRRVSPEPLDLRSSKMLRKELISLRKRDSLPLNVKNTHLKTSEGSHLLPTSSKTKIKTISITISVRLPLSLSFRIIMLVPMLSMNSLQWAMEDSSPCTSLPPSK